MKIKPQVVTRFAPSPTGLFHAGTYRTAVFAYLFARHHEGTFILRIEDTDRIRSKKVYEDNILETMSWLGLSYDYLHRQSEWVKEHESIIKNLVNRNQAYVSPEKGEDGVTRELVRFRNQNKVVTFTDAIRGPITMNTTALGDFVIAKSFTEPLFHLTVVADDALTGVNHVIRGDDHISNTPRQILIYEALGATIPTYAHLPLVLAPDRSKLSKRKGARAVSEYRDLGFLPEALLNYIASLGWNTGGVEEIFSKEELVERFSLDQVQKSGAIFDEVKLRWFNREHLKKISSDRFIAEGLPFLSKRMQGILKESGQTEVILSLLRERIETYDDIRALEESGELEYLVEAPIYEAEKLKWKQDPDLAVTKTHLEATLGAVSKIPEGTWTKESVREAVWSYAEAAGKGSVLWPFRFALTGKDKSPDPFEVAGILGKDETIRRIHTAISKLAHA